MNCPLCGGDGCADVASDKRRVYVLCPGCSLVFVPEMYHLTVEQERSRYALHNNTADNAGYVGYLEEVALVLATLVAPNVSVLDYGCGEHAVLTSILDSRRYNCTPFDPLYTFPHHPVRQNGIYAAVIVCEVIEHCRNVRETVLDINSALADKGVVLVRTQCYPEPAAHLPRWWYAQDPTHIAFFSTTTLAYVASLVGRKLLKTATEDMYLIA